MEEPLTQNSTVLKCSLAVHIYSTPGNEQLERQRPAQVSGSPSPIMKRQAEVNRFAIFLFCSLVPLGSLAPTATLEESTSTMAQRQKYSTTRIKPLASVIEKQATTLFKNYNMCSPVTSQTMSWLMVDSKSTAMVKKIPECPAFNAGCCVFRVFYDFLQNLRNDKDFFCKNVTLFVEANINQLNVILSEREELSTCKNKDLLQIDCGWVRRKTMADKMKCIWKVLQKYEQLMQNTTKMYS